MIKCDGTPDLASDKENGRTPSMFPQAGAAP